MKKVLLLIMFAILAFSNVQAQPGFDDEIEDTPVDGGVVVLLSMGVIYGVKRKKEEAKVD